MSHLGLENHKMKAGREQAEDQQPWRCAKCNEPVSHIRHNHCACTRELLEALGPATVADPETGTV